MNSLRVFLISYSRPLASVAALSALVGCGVASPASTSAGAADEEEVSSASDAYRFCPTEKIAFTRRTGCENDGSVEFCVPAGDLLLQARLRGIDADVTFVGSSGRARCDVATELLGMYPTRKEPHGECTPSGAMTHRAWRDVCRIAAEPSVRRVVPTFYE